MPHASHTVVSPAEEAVAVAFRGVMSQVASPVAVVTTMRDAQAHGTTVSAFTSLSMSPPMLLISLHKTSDLLAAVRAYGRFGVNILASHQSPLAQAFAKKGADKFRDVAWERHSGVPRLPNVAGWISCSVEQMVAGGDHIVIFGLVDSAEFEPAPPLTYHARVFGTHLPHSQDGS